MKLHVPHRRLRAVALVVTGGAGLALAFGAVSLARTNADISVCLDSRGYLFQPAPGNSCAGSTLTWNQQGSAGPAGPAGPQGQTGPAGPASGTAASLSSGAIRVVSTGVATKGNQLVGYATARCPSGFRAIGGGGYTHSSSIPGALTDSAPWFPNGIADEKKGLPPKGWRVRVARAKTGSHAWYVVASAVCVKTPETKVP